MARGSAGADTVTTVVATGCCGTPDRGPAAASDNTGTRTTTAATRATANQARTRYPITRGRPGCATGGSLPPVITIRRPAPGPPPGDASGRGPGQVDPTGRRSAASAPRSAAPPPNGLEERPHRSADRSQRAPGRRPTNDLSWRQIGEHSNDRRWASAGRREHRTARRRTRRAAGPNRTTAKHRRGVKLPDKSDHVTHWGDGATQLVPRTLFPVRGRSGCCPSRGSTPPAVNP